MNLVDRLIARARRTPYVHLTGYMERYWLVPYHKMRPGYDGTGPVSWRRPIARMLQTFGIAVRLHHILRSDKGRDFHDHPWHYCTIILRGGYWEHTPKGCKYHGAGSILLRRATSWHRLEVEPGKTAWTLFITGRRKQGWGFLLSDGRKVPYQEYRHP